MRSAPLLLALALSAALVAPAALATAPAAVDPAPTGVSSPAAITPADGTPASTPAQSDPADGIDDTEDALAGNETNQTHILAIPEPAIQRSDIRRATLNLGPAAEFSGNISAVRMETGAIVSYIEAAETDGERARRIRAAFRRIDAATTTLRDRRQAAIVDYNAERLTTEQFVIELAAVGATATALEDRLARLEELAAETDGFELDSTRVATLRYELRAFGGPVTDRAAAAVRGTASDLRLSITTGPEGYVLTTVVNDTYLREGFRGAVRSANRSASMSATEAAEVARQSYPTIYNRTTDISENLIGSGPTYIVSVPYGNSSLTAFVDSGSQRVFKEYQRIPLDSFVHTGVVSNVKSGLRLTINRTYPGGPVRINVTDAETGSPVNATITVSQGVNQGTVVGRTGEDGILWTLSPRGQYTVLAIRGETSVVFVETSASDPPAID